MTVFCLKAFLVVYALGLLFGTVVLLVWIGFPVLLAGVILVALVLWMFYQSIKNLLTF